MTCSERETFQGLLAEKGGKKYLEQRKQCTEKREGIYDIIGVLWRFGVLLEQEEW